MPCNFAKGRIATIDLQCVLSFLRPIFEKADRRNDRTEFTDLRVIARVRTAQHVRDKKVRSPIAVNVREINPHRKSAGAPNVSSANRAKSPMAVIDPDSIWRKQIVANVEVRSPIA